MFDLIKRTIRSAAVPVPCANALTVFAALDINSSFQIVNQYEVNDHWEQNLRRDARRKAEQLANTAIIDVGMTVEMSRLLYKRRCYIANSPALLMNALIDYETLPKITDMPGEVARDAYFWLWSQFDRNSDALNAGLISAMSNRAVAARMIDGAYEGFMNQYKNTPATLAERLIAFFTEVFNYVIEALGVVVNMDRTAEDVRYSPVLYLLFSDMTGDTASARALTQAWYDDKVFITKDGNIQRYATVASLESFNGGLEDFSLESHDSSVNIMHVELVDAMNEGFNKAVAHTMNEKFFPYFNENVFDLNHFEYEHTPEQNDIAMESFIGKMAKGVKSVIVKIFKLIAGAINAIIGLLTAPFPVKVSFKVTDPADDNEVHTKWTKQFPTGIDEYIETLPRFLSVPRTMQDYANRSLNLVESLSEHVITAFPKFQDGYTKSDRTTLRTMAPKFTEDLVKIKGEFDRITGEFRLFEGLSALDLESNIKEENEDPKKFNLVAVRQARIVKDKFDEALKRKDEKRKITDANIKALLAYPDFRAYETVEDRVEGLLKYVEKVIERTKQRADVVVMNNIDGSPIGDAYVTNAVTEYNVGYQAAVQMMAAIVNALSIYLRMFITISRRLVEMGVQAKYLKQ